MSKKNGRDWTEWHKQITGMHRIGNDWKTPPQKPRRHQQETTTSMTLPRGFRKEDQDEKREIIKWFLIFIALILARKTYFEMTKYEKIRNASSYKSRSR